jgi:hypothetical protein
MGRMRDVKCLACGETYQIPGDEERCRLCGESGKLRYLSPAPAVSSEGVLEVEPADAPPRAATSISALSILGTIITIIGVILFIGNITGLLPTFPAAGYLTIIIGGAIAGAGKARQKKA